MTKNAKKKRKNIEYIKGTNFLKRTTENKQRKYYWKWIKGGVRKEETLLVNSGREEKVCVMVFSIWFLQENNPFLCFFLQNFFPSINRLRRFTSAHWYWMLSTEGNAMYMRGMNCVHRSSVVFNSLGRGFRVLLTKQAKKVRKKN